MVLTWTGDTVGAVNDTRQYLIGDHPGFALARQAAAVLADKFGTDRHDIGVVLGSGWAHTITALGEVVAEVPFNDVPGLDGDGVAGHVQKITSVRLADGRRVLVFGSRTHFYASRDVQAVAHVVRTIAAAGAGVVVLTNGCGGLDPQLAPGTPVLIADHINLTGVTPLVGPEFVDMTDAYADRLRTVAKQVDPSLTEGVYVQFAGPQYETPAEVAMAARLGGDLVGMSTALDTIAARHVGLEVLGVSLVTNPGAGVTDAPLSHEDVLAAGEAAAPRVSKLLAEIIQAI
ncbi:purine-nucleoside phosphorylase [Enteractinococcus coprophilus]|uniref:Purine nucleoside phosphorylase n=1 Tax=Enteractinococcus coprophilus TaxID=1027633 RepID=A0A543AF88_9MICC|nr:purine-nucleoside phosphorylase [Enteractinococcus coprophilus]